MPFAALNGIKLYYESHGSGPAIIFAHGAGGNHLSWWQQIPHFQQSFRCITFDHRAFGLSRDLPGGPGRAEFAPDVIALADQLGIDRFVFVAQSMGGRTAAGLVRRIPQRLHGVVFAGSTGGSVDDEVRSLQRAHLQSLPESERPLLARAIWSRYADQNPQMAFLYRQIQRLNPTRPADFLALQPGYRGSFSGALSESGVPVLFLVGEHDAITPPHIVERAAALVAGARFRVIPEAGHSAYFERPQEFNGAISAFIQELDESTVQGTPTTRA